ncbi:formylmethanofuran dehydrogenase subunit B [Candidatus Alkanophaga liquidiphilum]
MVVFEMAVCPFCACLCDDIVVRVEGNEIKEVRNACTLGVRKFLAFRENRLETPLIGGEERSYDDALREAAEILKGAERPLIYGLSNTGCSAQKLALRLARRLNGICDNTESLCHNLFHTLQREFNLFSTTLDAVKDNADVVVFWGCNPVHSHPRHLSKFSYAEGRFLPKGITDREIVCVDVVTSELDKIAKWFLRVRPGADAAVCEALWTMVGGTAGGGGGEAAARSVKALAEAAGVSVEDLSRVAETLKNASFGVVFFGLGVAASENAKDSVAALFSLVEALSGTTNFAMFPMKGHFNVVGAVITFLRETGFPFGVDFSGGNARFEPGKTTALDVLEGCDAALIVGADPIASFPKEKAKLLAKMPLIVLDPFRTPTVEAAAVTIPTALTGVETEETAYRMDCLPLKLKKLVEGNKPTDRDFLLQLHNAV